MHVGQRGHRALGLGSGGVAFHIRFRPSIADFHTLVKPGQILHRRRPIVVRVQRHFLDHDAVRAQRYLQLGRPQVILVLRVVPDLLHRRLGGLRRAGVQDREPARGVAADLRLTVARHALFGHGVGDRLAVFKLRQILPRHRQRLARRVRGDGPVVFRAHRLDRAVAHLSEQVQLHFRALAVAVIVVAPDLGGRNVHGARDVPVRERRHAVLGRFARRVVFDLRLAPRVGDLLARLILRQVFLRRGPVVRRAQRHILHLRAVRVQRRRQRRRPDAVLVVRVVPDLHHRRLGGLRNVLVRERRHAVLGRFARRVVFDLRLAPRVGDLLARLILRQVFLRRGPVVRRAQRHILHLRAVRVQRRRQRRRPDAVLVVRVVPDLHDRGRNPLLIGVDERDLFAVAVSLGQLQRAVVRVAVLHLHRHGVRGGIVGHAVHRQGFGNGVRVGVPDMRFGVPDLPEAEFRRPACRRLDGHRCLLRHRRSDRRRNGERPLVARLKGAVHDGLDAVQRRLALRAIRVGDGDVLVERRHRDHHAGRLPFFGIEGRHVVVVIPFIRNETGYADRIIDAGIVPIIGIVLVQLAVLVQAIDRQIGPPGDPGVGIILPMCGQIQRYSPFGRHAVSVQFKGHAVIIVAMREFVHDGLGGRRQIAAVQPRHVRRRFAGNLHNRVFDVDIIVVVIVGFVVVAFGVHAVQGHVRPLGLPGLDRAVMVGLAVAVDIEIRIGRAVQGDPPAGGHAVGVQLKHDLAAFGRRVLAQIIPHLLGRQVRERREVLEHGLADLLADAAVVVGGCHQFTGAFRIVVIEDAAFQDPAFLDLQRLGADDFFLVLGVPLGGIGDGEGEVFRRRHDGIARRVFNDQESPRLADHRRIGFAQFNRIEVDRLGLAVLAAGHRTGTDHDVLILRPPEAVALRALLLVHSEGEGLALLHVAAVEDLVRLGRPEHLVRLRRGADDNGAVGADAAAQRAGIAGDEHRGAGRRLIRVGLQQHDVIE